MSDDLINKPMTDAVDFVASLQATVEKLRTSLAQAEASAAGLRGALSDCLKHWGDYAPERGNARKTFDRVRELLSLPPSDYGTRVEGLVRALEQCGHSMLIPANGFCPTDKEIYDDRARRVAIAQKALATWRGGK